MTSNEPNGMPDSIERFAVSADGFTFPVEDVLTGRGFITGKSGSGKSNTASVIVEELLDRNLPLLIVDTDGEYTGLTEAYDLLHVGRGSDCDLELSAEDAGQLPTYALEDRVPILLDLSTYLEADETEAVLYEAIKALFDAEQDHRIPFLILLEEAHEFVPQQGGRGRSDLQTLLVRVAKRGRKRGLGICCLSQRPASVDKDYITQCDWFVWHRLTWENDTAVVGRILGTDTAETVQSLGDGEAIVQTDWDETTERVQFRRKRTADAGSTPSLDDLDRSSDENGFGQKSEVLTKSESIPPPDGTTRASNADGESPGGDDSDPSPIPADRTQMRYDEIAVPSASYSTARRKPSLERRRERRETPTDATDPIWEIGAIVVYLYDSLVWYHLVVVSTLETRVAHAVSRSDDAVVDGRMLRQPGTYERYAYRLLAVLGVCAFYAFVVVALLLVT